MKEHHPSSPRLYARHTNGRVDSGKQFNSNNSEKVLNAHEVETALGTLNDDTF